LISVPDIRIRACNEAAVRENGDYVLHWMIAARRTRWNFALDRAVEWSRRPRKPVVTREALRWQFPRESGSRDPNSYSGVSWCLGRYVHPWDLSGRFSARSVT